MGTNADSATAVAYTRVSTDVTTQELGLEAQRRAIGAWAEGAGVRIVEWFGEECSGGAPLEHRTGLVSAVDAVRRHKAGALVVARLDRYSRDPAVAAVMGAELARVGARVRSAAGEGDGDDPASKLIQGILIQVAGYERSVIKLRIKAALAVKQARGEMTGAPRYGMRLAADGKHVEPEPSEAAVVERIHALTSAGRSVLQIVRELDDDGVRGRTGKPLSRQAVYNVLARA